MSDSLQLWPLYDPLPEAVITADCTVDFPGETAKQFLGTIGVMEVVC